MKSSRETVVGFGPGGVTVWARWMIGLIRIRVHFLHGEIRQKNGGLEMAWHQYVACHLVLS